MGLSPADLRGIIAFVVFDISFLTLISNLLHSNAEMRLEELEKLRKELAKMQKALVASRSQKKQKTTENTLESPSKVPLALTKVVLALPTLVRLAKPTSLPPLWATGS